MKAIRQAKNRALRQPYFSSIQKSTGRLATEPKEKIEKLKKVLLPTPQFANLSNIQGFEYPNGLEMPKITQYKIFQTFRYFQTRKGPRPDQILNKVLKIIVLKICSFLEQIFNNSLILSHYISHFKESIVFILHKIGGNRDYTSSKNYWAISLFNILGRIMEAILATRISYIATADNLLLKTHFRGRQGSCIETAVHNFLEKVYIVQNNNKTALLLIIDISAAYSNTSHQRLLYNLCK